MRSSIIGGLATALTAAAFIVPSGSAEAAGNCTIWRSTGEGSTGFARCTQFDGASHFRLRVTCSNGSYKYSPAVRLSQTTWATCSSGRVTEHTLYRA